VLAVLDAALGDHSVVGASARVSVSSDVVALTRASAAASLARVAASVCCAVRRSRSAIAPALNSCSD
jgi:hypothetical protein